MSVIDDWEDGDTAEYTTEVAFPSTTTVNYTTVTSPVYNGSNAGYFDITTQDYNNDDVYAYNTSITPPAQGEQFSIWVRVTDSYFVPGMTYGYSGVSSNYTVFLVAGSDQCRLTLNGGYNTGGSTLSFGNLDSAVSTGTWYQIVMQWKTDNTHTWEVFDSGGTSLGSFTVTDSTHTSGDWGTYHGVSGTGSGIKVTDSYHDYAQTQSLGGSTVSESGSFAASAAPSAVESSTASEASSFAATASPTANESVTGLSWPFPNWDYRKSVTVDSAQVTADQSNYAVPIKITGDTDLANKAQSSGDDILFSDGAGSQLDHEIETFDSANGDLWAWVEVPTLTSGSDTSLYLYYGNSGASNQENVTGTWDSDYLGVYHFYDDPSGGTLSDSAGSNDGSVPANSISSVSGVFNKAWDFDGATYATFPDMVGGQGAITVEYWIYNPSYDDGRGFNTDGTGSSQVLLWPDDTGSIDWIVDSSRQDSADDSPSGQVHAVGTFDGSAIEAWVNANSAGTSSHSGSVSTGSNNYFGGEETGTTYFTDIADEMRISSVARSDSYIQTTYNLISTGASAITVGAEETQTTSISESAAFTATASPSVAADQGTADGTGAFAASASPSATGDALASDSGSAAASVAPSAVGNALASEAGAFTASVTPSSVETGQATDAVGASATATPWAMETVTSSGPTTESVSLTASVSPEATESARAAEQSAFSATATPSVVGSAEATESAAVASQAFPSAADTGTAAETPRTAVVSSLTGPSETLVVAETPSLTATAAFGLLESAGNEASELVSMTVQATAGAVETTTADGVATSSGVATPSAVESTTLGESAVSSGTLAPSVVESSIASETGSAASAATPGVLATATADESGAFVVQSSLTLTEVLGTFSGVVELVGVYSTERDLIGIWRVDTELTGVYDDDKDLSSNL